MLRELHVRFGNRFVLVRVFIEFYSFKVNTTITFLGATGVSVIMRGLFLDRLIDKTYRKERSTLFCHRCLMQLLYFMLLMEMIEKRLQ